MSKTRNFFTLQDEYLQQRKSNLREKLKFKVKYIEGLLCVSYKEVCDFLKYKLKQKVLKCQFTGNTFCRKTRLTFAIIKDQLYVNVNWLYKMIECELVKI